MPKQSGMILLAVLSALAFLSLIYAYVEENTRLAMIVAMQAADYRQAKQDAEQNPSRCDQENSILEGDFQQVDITCQQHKTKVHLRKVRNVAQNTWASWIEVHDTAT
jgi:hypothetical protein